MPTPKPIRLSRIRTEYLSSTTFLALAESTQSYYRRSLERIRPAKLNTSNLCGPTIKGLLAPFEGSPGAYNKARGALGAMLSWAAGEYPVMIPNPVGAVPAKPLGSISRWPQGDAQRAIASTEGSLRTAIILMDATAARLCDVIRMKPENLKGNVLEFVQQKTGVRSSAVLEHRVLGYLNSLGVVPGNNFVGNHPLTLSENMLQMRWLSCRERIFGAGNKYTLHGIRKANSCEAAENGANPLQIKAMLGHKTIRASMIYVAEADSAKLAQQAMELRHGRNQ